MFDKEYIKNELINQDYNDHNAGLVADELMKLSPELAPCLEAWMKGETRDFVSNGFCITSLIEERHMTYPAALLTIDWLLKEPEKANRSLKHTK